MLRNVSAGTLQRARPSRREVRHSPRYAAFSSTAVAASSCFAAIADRLFKKRARIFLGLAIVVLCILSFSGRRLASGVGDLLPSLLEDQVADAVEDEEGAMTGKNPGFIDLSNPLRSSTLHPNSAAEDDFVIIMDCGSLGSRIHVFSYRKGQKLSLKEVAVSKVEVGISSFANSPKDAFRSLVPLLDFAELKVPRGKYSATPLFIFATAGVRRLGQSKSDSLMRAISTGIGTSYHFEFDPRNVRVISGNMEGLFEWISVNFLLGNLGSLETQCSNSSQAELKLPTTGILEMGGASLQIVYEVEDPEQGHVPDVFSLRFSECISYHIYASSFLDFGVRSSRERYVSRLVESSSTVVHTNSIKEPIEDPCLLSGQSVRFSDRDTISGSGDLHRCSESIRSLNVMNENLPCPSVGGLSGNCVYNGVFQPNFLSSNSSFVGLRDFFYVYSALFDSYYDSEEYKFSAELDFQTFESLAETFCRSSWNEASSRLLVRDAELLCYRAAWALNVMRQHNLDQNSVQVQLLQDLHGVDISWTMGAAFLHVQEVSIRDL